MMTSLEQVQYLKQAYYVKSQHEVSFSRLKYFEQPEEDTTTNMISSGEEASEEREEVK
jgi:hypothetical protein